MDYSEAFPKTLKTALETELTKFYSGQERTPFRDFIVYNKDDIPTGIPKTVDSIIPSVSLTGLAFVGILLLMLVVKK